MTTAKGGPNVVDYKSSAYVFHGNENPTQDPKHQDLDVSVHKFMKKPNYAIGKEGNDAPNEKETSANTFHKEIPDDGRRDKNDRRADPTNPNKIKTVGFGFGSEKGTKEHQVTHR